jgi:hypothetical protein
MKHFLLALLAIACTPPVPQPRTAGMCVDQLMEHSGALNTLVDNRHRCVVKGDSMKRCLNAGPLSFNVY